MSKSKRSFKNEVRAREIGGVKNVLLRYKKETLVIGGENKGRLYERRVRCKVLVVSVTM